MVLVCSRMASQSPSPVTLTHFKKRYPHHHAMKIINRYILSHLLQMLLVTAGIFSVLFLVFDFFDRIDNIIQEKPRLGIIAEYFILKIPQTLTLMLPIAMLVSTLLTIGLLAKNSELTAIRASGITVYQLAVPVLLVGFGVSIASLCLNETLVPYSVQRVKEIYNIDIKQKDKNGAYSQSDFWWRNGKSFYSVGIFDSRTDTLSGMSRFDTGPQMRVVKRVNSNRVHYLDPLLGWNMAGVTEYTFHQDPSSPVVVAYPQLPLPIEKTPTDFFDAETDPSSMSFQALLRHIKDQEHNGIRVNSLYTDLYAKFSFPFISTIMALIVLPFSLKPARSGSMATSIIAALCIGFGYYVIHSFSISLGRAEILPPLVAAWLANGLMATVGSILLAGAENPL
jgi:lipopolysaccharide export system permease protein